MLTVIHSMKELCFSDLVQVYDESVQTMDQQSDFYDYLRQVFFRTPGAVYCVWVLDGTFVSALRLEPYRDGWIVAGLETGTAYRGQGYAGELLGEALRWLKDQGSCRVYSHIEHCNGTSICVHLRCGFRKIGDCAVFLDGSASNRAGTYLYEG